eukprot:CAMPEP_0173247714 /NCGR_PEP_ID=MMETSP1142-20121109/18046_1 /TAXON_ID=483371 /ORGANISM="non described non described, Strain CCMP2298" /LENGTH=127 /DNA_ID=CAMNT_0014180119 /DNA_START=711 /DNA_END=1094 /DNA_ORIENTATION=-
MGGVVVLGAHRDDDLADGDTGSHVHGLAVGVAHAGGEAIRAGTGEHFVLADHVERVAADLDVVSLLARGLGQVLVAGDAGGLQSGGGQLLLLAGDQVRHEGEHVDHGLLGPAVENPDLGVGHASAEP